MKGAEGEDTTTRRRDGNKGYFSILALRCEWRFRPGVVWIALGIFGLERWDHPRTKNPLPFQKAYWKNGSSRRVVASLC